MLLHSSVKPPVRLCRLNPEVGISSSPCPVSLPDGPTPGSKPSPVLRDLRSQEARGPGEDSCLPGPLTPGPCAHGASSRLQPVAWGAMPRRKAGLQPGVEGEVPTICSVKTQIAQVPQTPSPNSQLLSERSRVLSRGTTTALPQSIRYPALPRANGHHQGTHTQGAFLPNPFPSPNYSPASGFTGKE